jgi:hypothetical protein
MVVALLVALASVPTLAAVLAGSASLDTATKPRTPFVADAPQGPVVVPGPGVTAPGAPGSPVPGEDLGPGAPATGAVDPEPLPPSRDDQPAAGRRSRPIESGHVGGSGHGTGGPGRGTGGPGRGTGQAPGSGSTPGTGPVPSPDPGPGGGGQPECTPVPEGTSPSERPPSPSSGPGGSGLIDVVGDLLGGIGGLLGSG